MTFRKVDLIFCGAGVAGRRRCGLAALSARPVIRKVPANSVHQAITVESQCNDLSCTQGVRPAGAASQAAGLSALPRGQAGKRGTGGCTTMVKVLILGRPCYSGDQADSTLKWTGRRPSDVDRRQRGVDGCAGSVVVRGELLAP